MRNESMQPVTQIINRDIEYLSVAAYATRWLSPGLSHFFSSDCFVTHNLSAGVQNECLWIRATPVCCDVEIWASTGFSIWCEPECQ